MSARAALSFILALLVGPASAQDMMDRVEEAVATTSDVDKVSEDAHEDIVPDFGSELPHDVEPDAAVLEENGQLLAISDTDEGNRYTQFSEKTQEWGPTALDASLLDTADAAVADPEAIVGNDLFSTTSESGDLCSVTSISEAPRFTRSCDRAANVEVATCTETATVSTQIVQGYACDLANSNALVPPCDVMQAHPSCEEVTGTACTDFFGAHVACDEPLTGTFICTTPEPIANPSAFTIPWIADPTEYLDTERTCTPNYDEVACTLESTTCPGGPDVVFVNGVATPVACGELIDTYSCISDTYVDDCALFTDASCELLGSECIFQSSVGTCLTFEDTYECGADVEGSFDAECDAVTVCVGDVCQSIETEPSTGFAESIAHVAMVNDMVKNNDVTDQSWVTYFWTDEDDLRLFTGDVKQCGRAIFGSVNCCKDTGWALGSLAQCNTQEIELYAANEAGRTVYMNTYCSAWLLVCTVKKRRYCVYGSKLARVISEEVFRVNGWDFECRGLTYDELQSVDFAQLDLSEVYGDLVEGTALPNPEALVDALADNILATQPVLEESYGE